MTPHEVGRALKAWRLSKPWSQATLAQELGMTPTQICRLEHGKHRMSPLARRALQTLGFAPENKC